jgi:hypothetical protein
VEQEEKNLNTHIIAGNLLYKLYEKFNLVVSKLSILKTFSRNKPLLDSHNLVLHLVVLKERH